MQFKLSKIKTSTATKLRKQSLIQDNKEKNFLRRLFEYTEIGISLVPELKSSYVLFFFQYKDELLDFEIKV